MPLSFFDAATNLFPDPGFESGVITSTYWVAGAGVDDTSAMVGKPAIEGTYSLCLATPGSGTETLIIEHGWELAADPGSLWSVGCTAGFVTTGMVARLGLTMLDAGRVAVGTTTASTTAGQRDVVDLEIEGIVAATNAAYARVTFALVRQGAAANVPGVAIFDRVVVSNTDEVLPWFSGDTGGSAWVDTPYAGASTRAGQALAFEHIKRLVPHYFISEEGV